MTWDFDWKHAERAFFGETPEPVGAALAPLIRGTHVRRGTVDELWEMRIADGECPRGSCVGKLDESDCCSLCGWSLVEHRMRERIRAKEDKPDWLPTFPGALQLDEYAPASTEDEAA